MLLDEFSPGAVSGGYALCGLWSPPRWRTPWARPSLTLCSQTQWIASSPPWPPSAPVSDRRAWHLVLGFAIALPILAMAGLPAGLLLTIFAGLSLRFLSASHELGKRRTWKKARPARAQS